MHWNFFHTIAMVGLLAEAVPPAALATVRGAALAAAAVTAAHQALLSLSEWALGRWTIGIPPALWV